MKKTISITFILIGGFVFATPPQKKELITINKEKTWINIFQEDSFLTVKRGATTYFAETSCGVVATTTQDWTPQEASEWRDKIEANYCQIPTYSGSDSAHLANN